MAEETNPADPMTDPMGPFGPLIEGAVIYHELFTALVTVGFTREEALVLVIEFIRTSR